MPRPDRALNGFRVFIGGVDPGVGKVDIEREFDRFGPIADVWVARNPPGFAFIVFKYSEDADRAVRRMDGRLRVEHAVNNAKSGGGREERKLKIDERRNLMLAFYDRSTLTSLPQMTVIEEGVLSHDPTRNDVIESL
ncbi:unnamed protein product [Echinostoma caproni]|uniref:RRM domain-containing protein n=1 Tax=Echinostoma caproni TaxID=27848 RepID=A0A183AUV2_9TREM|nr:unnamed protein product [Echinostoma caproni]